MPPRRHQEDKRIEMKIKIKKISTMTSPGKVVSVVNIILMSFMVVSLLLFCDFVEAKARRRRPLSGPDMFRGKNLAVDKLHPGEKIINVLNFKAKPDGKTDCTQVIYNLTLLSISLIIHELVTYMHILAINIISTHHCPQYLSFFMLNYPYLLHISTELSKMSSFKASNLLIKKRQVTQRYYNETHNSVK